VYYYFIGILRTTGRKKGPLPLFAGLFFFFDSVRALTGSGRASPKFPVVEGILSRVEGIWRNEEKT
jgi:hypothetical protein